MSVIKVRDLAYGRLRAPDLDVMEEFLTNFGMIRSARTPNALYMRGTDPKHHIHITEKGDPKFVAFGYYEAANRGTAALRDILSQYMRLWLWSLPPGRKHVAFYDTRTTKRKHPDWYRDDLARLFALLAAGGLKPVITDRLPLEEAVTAHRKLEQAQVQGKLVLTPNP